MICKVRLVLELCDTLPTHLYWELYFLALPFQQNQVRNRRFSRLYGDNSEQHEARSAKPPLLPRDRGPNRVRCVWVNFGNLTTQTLGEKVGRADISAHACADKELCMQHTIAD